MRAHRIKAHVAPNQPLLVPLPPDTPEADVEVIVLFPEETAEGQGFASLREFNDWLKEQPGSGRSQEEIERHIAEERASWE
jgi:hypothetical protein